MKLLMDDIGEVHFTKNAKSRNLRITVKPFKGIRVTLPYTISFSSAISFVQGKKDWIQKSLGRIKEIENKKNFFLANNNFRTKYHELKLIPHHYNDFRGKTEHGIYYFYYPEHMAVYSKEVQEKIKSGILWLLRKEAKAYLPFRVVHLAEKYKFSFEKVSVKNLKSRWGSCSYKNNINLNIHLMRLPDHLIDYVILHELVHTIHKNHGKTFWHCLDQLCGDAYGLRKEMRTYRIDL